MYRATVRSLTFVLFAGLASTAALGCSSDDAAAKLEPQAYNLPEGKARFDDQLARVDAQLSAATERADLRPDDWMPRAAVASGLQGRARLSGDLADLVAADEALDQAFALAPEGGGPWLARASADFAMHRFEESAQALDTLEGRVLIDDPTRAAIMGLRGDLILQAGDVTGALELLEAAEGLDPTSTSAGRLAHARWRSGDYQAAEAGYLVGLERYHGSDPAVPAWFHLQLGILDLERDDLDGALAHFFDANAELSGYYLIEEHIAEVWTLQGNTEQALGLYLDVIERTQNPEFMDAVAGIYDAAGRGDARDGWIDKARAGYEAQLELAPEAAYGHAIGHYLDFGDPGRAVDLAERSHALRPNASAKVELIHAYLAAERTDDALALADALAIDDWRTADTLDAAITVYEAAGRDASADPLRVELCDMAPRRCG